MTTTMGLDIGSNSVGSAWYNWYSGDITIGLSIFPAGVDETEEQRGEPKNTERRRARRTRITLARRAKRKRLLRLKLISAGLLPDEEKEFKDLLEKTDPWDLRRKGLTEPLMPHEFGRVLLHLAQRRGAVGFDAEIGDKGSVKGAIVRVQLEMLQRFGSAEMKRVGQEFRDTIDSLNKKKKRTEKENEDLDHAQEELKKLCKSLLQDSTVTFGRFIAEERNSDKRRLPITSTDHRKHKRGPREWREPVRNRDGDFKFHADRAMIHDEFAKLWKAQKGLNGPLAQILTEEMRHTLEDESHDSLWRHKGVLFGQRKASWDVGTLGRCVLEPTERCVPRADMYASRYLVVELINNLRVIERNREKRPLTREERAKLKTYLSGPLGLQTKGKNKGQPKRSVTISDLRDQIDQLWKASGRTLQFRLDRDPDEEFNTDWFSREIIHGAISVEKWESLSNCAREGINRAILKHDPDEEHHADKLKKLVMQDWVGLTETQADVLVAAWKKRPRLDAKRLNRSRRAVRNLLRVMDRDEPWPDSKWPGETRWLTEIEARKIIAKDLEFKDETTGQVLDDHARRRYATGAKGATARDRHYMSKHLLKKNGKEIFDPQGELLHEPPPAPMISNPVVRKAIHEVRRHLIEYMTTFARKPDEVRIELSREAKMGKKDADRVLFQNRLRNRIRNEILCDSSLNIEWRSSTQQRAATDRVILWIQQKGVCALCGNKMVSTEITLKNAADGAGCEMAHIIPKACGGHNGFGNLVLAHDKCNRDMKRRTPREFWDEQFEGGFEEGFSCIENIFAGIDRVKASEMKTLTGQPLWRCYFTKRDDLSKIEQFKKEVKDIQEMMLAQDAATKYATSQVMTYIADAIFDGKGLPERGGPRLIFDSHKRWTGRMRDEWDLYFDAHGAKEKNLQEDEQHGRKQKNRGDHRHHAIDALVTALCTREVQIAWEERERQADRDGVNTADEQAIRTYRRQHRLPPPVPYKSIEDFGDAVRKAVYGDGQVERPVFHRPVKRKIIGALHEASLFGPALDKSGNHTGKYTAKKNVLSLDANHLRPRVPEPRKEALARFTEEFKAVGMKPTQAKQKAEAILNNPSYQPLKIDPPPGKSGIVRDIALRMRIRKCLSGYKYVKKNKNGEPTGESWFVNPDDFTANEMKQAFEAGAICQASGVPIRSVVLLRTMDDPVIVSRWASDHTGKRYKVYDADTDKGDRRAARAYVGGNNHHIEIRVTKNKKGIEDWSGRMVTTFEAAQRKLARLRAIQKAGIPRPKDFRKLSKAERAKYRPLLKAIEMSNPLVDRSDNKVKGGQFVMSLCEGEILFMKRKGKKCETGDIGYFVVAKLDKPQSIVLVPHWDARPATIRKDPNDPSGKTKIPNSNRDHFTATPADLKKLAPSGHDHAVKVRVSPLGKIHELNGD